jgi:signal transduction histidine kinase
LAELSASIAHEVNQPLAAIVANSHACLRWLTADPPNLDRAHTTVERIIRDANGAADVVSRTRALFKQSVKTRSACLLTSVIADARRLVADAAAGHRVTLELHVEPGIPLISIDPVQIQQVLINLMRNAVEAMAASHGTRILSLHAFREQDSVRVEVRDTGAGIDDTEKVFEAFFTTKESGMGMGLAVSRTIVESHSGRLWAERNEDGGSSFIFVLPIEARAST